jgi:site-specific DNA recombinase
LPHVAALYSRVSSKPQAAKDKTSLATQEAGEQRWAREHGWLTDERFSYHEKHTGEELWERPELTRLSRNPLQLGIVVDELARLGIDVQLVTQALDDSPEGGLIAYIKSYAGQLENERRRERQMRATRARAERGFPIGTSKRPPYDYA